ncbi:MAG: hypothetical protein HY735_25870 [Verrucomicrobia bacterium]|nr:hypothetical protein [Verrucomicrobiota bacterium]
MAKEKTPTTVVYQPVARAVDDTALQTMDFASQAQAERLAENTVAWMDDSMQSFAIANNPFNKNMRWSESRVYTGELASYDADFHMRSPANLPPGSPDASADDKVGSVGTSTSPA